MTSHSEMFADLLGGENSPPEAPPAVSATLPYEMDERGLAALLSLSLSQVRTKAREGVFVRSSRGRYDVEESVRRYVVRLRESASRAGRPGDEPTDPHKRERTRLAREQADATALKNAQLRGELVPVAETLRAWQIVLRDVRAGMLAVPSRYAASQPHLTAHDIETLTAEIKHALEGLADGND
ncbi:hypothetical protein AKL17_3696 [Frigidibacter mobilis]|uniref:Phage DNA packaging protein, Nu1 subunit of terminase n=2 Tax=Frigidibacter mobilis TaxID=1335048 RepID=A0A165STI2_9RHOB|nr:hypothetical protein AKL17_3696 [Frigidibacter mobilis]